MKVFYGALIAGLTFINTLQAIPSNFGQSTREYKAIFEAYDVLKTVISEYESIFNIERMSDDLSDSTAYYKITTRQTLSNDEIITRDYLLKMSFKKNPLIGPKMICIEEIILM
jgi:hypothetical protein